MHQTLEFLLRHGYWVLFAWVLAEQLGAPVPSLPILLAMGALIGLRHDPLPLLRCRIAFLAAIAADSAWYLLGRRKGTSVLTLLCRISLEPDSCVSNTRDVVQKIGRLGPGNREIRSRVGHHRSAHGRPVAHARVEISVHRRRRRPALGRAYTWASATYFASNWKTWAKSRSTPAAGCSRSSAPCWEAGSRGNSGSGNVSCGASASPASLPKKCWSVYPTIVILDLRSSTEVEFDGMKLPGASGSTERSWSSDTMEIPRDRDMVLYCT